MNGAGADDDEFCNWRELLAQAQDLPDDAPPADKRARGFRFEKILLGMLNEADLQARARFRPKGEELDGSFVHHGHTLLLEAKWTAGPQPASALYAFKGKVDGKLVGTVGLFVSMGGFSDDAVDALMAGKEVNLVLADADDIGAVARGDVSITELLDQKLRHAAEVGNPYLTRDAIGRTGQAPPTKATVRNRRTVVVEGQFDVRLLQAVVAELGPPRVDLRFVPSGGSRNLFTVADAVADTPSEPIIIVADHDMESGALVPAWALDRESDAIRLHLMTPTLEQALGILPDGYVAGRRRVLDVSQRMLEQQVVQARLKERRLESPQVENLLKDLGL